jgi:hypothetical protein
MRMQNFSRCHHFMKALVCLYLRQLIHGIPVLAANNSSMPEVAGDVGLLVDAEDISFDTGGDKSVND